MTKDEMERAIDFVLKEQANLEMQLAKTDEQLAKTDEQLEKTDEQLERTGRQVEILAETQSEFLRTMVQHVESQVQINVRAERGHRALVRAQKRTSEELLGLARRVAGLENRS